ncbi:hypothetical protein TKK_0015596 [Trichogramma kaykai]
MFSRKRAANRLSLKDYRDKIKLIHAEYGENSEKPPLEPPLKKRKESFNDYVEMQSGVNDASSNNYNDSNNSFNDYVEIQSDVNDASSNNSNVINQNKIMQVAEFIEELNVLLKSGITIGEKNIPVEIMCFICDLPARAFIKGTKGHTGFNSCERCVVHGYKKGSVIFPVDESNKRSDNSFRMQVDPDHHHKVSLLTLITSHVDMIQDFVLDFMHLGSLAIMKRLLTEYWMKPEKIGLKKEQILRISQRLVNISDQIPVEFERTTRSLAQVKRFAVLDIIYLNLFFFLFLILFVIMVLFTLTPQTVCHYFFISFNGFFV